MWPPLAPPCQLAESPGSTGKVCRAGRRGLSTLEETGKGAGQRRGGEKDKLRAGAPPPIPQHTQELQNILAEYWDTGEG